MRKLLILLIILTAAVAALAHEPHPTRDNMCGSPGYGSCVNQGQWEKGWYQFLCHSGDSRCKVSFQYSFDAAYHVRPSAIPNQFRDPVATPIPYQPTDLPPGEDPLHCNVHKVTVDGKKYQKCISQAAWCDIYDPKGWFSPRHCGARATEQAP